MQRDVYITDEERIKCRRVAKAYAEIDDEKVKVIEIGRFGFLRLLYYKYPYGFDDVITYFDSRELFEDLWQDWLYDQLQKIAEENPVLMELDDDELFETLPEEKKKELLDKRVYFAERSRLVPPEGDGDKELEADRGMDFNLFKDRIFEFLNGDDLKGIVDIDTDDLNDTFIVTMISGRMFEVQCREVG